MEKTRLNDEQWAKLLALQPVPMRERRERLGAPMLSSRLSSHGLIAAHHAGREYITDQGVLRVNQGR